MATFLSCHEASSQPTDLTMTHSQAPIGELRWRPPKKFEQRWDKVRDATKPGWVFQSFRCLFTDK
ncbi:hypothetical protein BC936DRAFT_139343 [Jimgerdemannia flammicorona]|uniref:Uncharacterized protein n=1 Tax=Jimgerdemannia flammicorona TaxID=994334 RepID=A0A433DHR4_9FUNG|nr:hypothetical protein BC936DRAFT_139343 [Jimgerdemannia flammicorona]